MWKVLLHKISKSKKNRNRLYYGYDFGCGFISWCALINDWRRYSTKGIDEYIRDEQSMAMVQDAKKQEMKDEIKGLSSKLEVLEMVVSNFF